MAILTAVHQTKPVSSPRHHVDLKFLFGPGAYELNLASLDKGTKFILQRVGNADVMDHDYPNMI